MVICRNNYVNFAANFSSFSTKSARSRRRFVTAGTKIVTELSSFAQSCAVGIMVPVIRYPQPHFPSTGLVFSLSFSRYSSTGDTLLHRVKHFPAVWAEMYEIRRFGSGFEQLPIFTIFHPNMRHSFSLFMIDLQTGLRYNISINLSNSSAHPSIFEQTGGKHYEFQCQTRIHGPHHQF